MDTRGKKKERTKINGLFEYRKSNKFTYVIQKPRKDIEKNLAFSRRDDIEPDFKLRNSGSLFSTLSLEFEDKQVLGIEIFWEAQTWKWKVSSLCFLPIRFFFNNLNFRITLKSQWQSSYLTKLLNLIGWTRFLVKVYSADRRHGYLIFFFFLSISKSCI